MKSRIPPATPRTCPRRCPLRTGTPRTSHEDPRQAAHRTAWPDEACTPAAASPPAQAARPSCPA
eukprot:2221298-Pyramimonas_sp.AAC.2